MKRCSISAISASSCSMARVGLGRKGLACSISGKNQPSPRHRAGCYDGRGSDAGWMNRMLTRRRCARPGVLF